MTAVGAIWLFISSPFGLLLFSPLCALFARRKHRDSETWFLLGFVAGPIALAWILAVRALPRQNDAAVLTARRRRTPAARIPTVPPVPWRHCLLCGQPLPEVHHCSPELVEDRIQGRWTVRVGGQRILGGL
jgi:hypothetical protein